MSLFQSSRCFRFYATIFVAALVSSSFTGSQAQEKESPKTSPAVSKQKAISIGVQRLLEVQHEDGAWPYEGVYRVGGNIPVGYRIGGTAISCEALFYATDKDNQEAKVAIERGIKLILTELEDPLMAPSKANRYDVRVWGHIYALDLFCRIKNSGRFAELQSQFEPWISKLTTCVVEEELEQGGWNYAGRRSHAGLVTAPALQALFWAKQVGEDVPMEVFQRGSNALFRSRNGRAAFAYSGDDRKNRPAKLPGSIARSANCEITLELLGHPRQNAIQFAIDSFHEHWDELEKRRKKTGTHKPPFGVAPYYFYYGHRYAAQAVQGLPEKDRAAEYEKLFDVLLRTRDEDGTWNDRIFAQSRAYGTAMAVLSLLEDKAPMPQGFSATKQVYLDQESTQKRLTITVGPEIAKPDLVVDVSAGNQVELYDQTMPVEKMSTWLKSNLPQRKPSVILINASNVVKTKIVEQVKQDLTICLGECTMFVAVEE